MLRDDEIQAVLTFRERGSRGAGRVWWIVWLCGAPCGMYPCRNEEVHSAECNLTEVFLKREKQTNKVW